MKALERDGYHDTRKGFADFIIRYLIIFWIYDRIFFIKICKFFFLPISLHFLWKQNNTIDSANGKESLFTYQRYVYSNNIAQIILFHIYSCEIHIFKTLKLLQANKNVFQKVIHIYFLLPMVSKGEFARIDQQNMELRVLKKFSIEKC